MNLTKRIPINMVTSYLNEGSRVGVSFFLTPFVLAAVGEQAFGLFPTALAIVTWFAMMGQAGEYGTCQSVASAMASEDTDRAGRHYTAGILQALGLAGVMVAMTWGLVVSGAWTQGCGASLAGASTMVLWILTAGIAVRTVAMSSQAILFATATYWLRNVCEAVFYLVGGLVVWWWFTERGGSVVSWLMIVTFAGFMAMGLSTSAAMAVGSMVGVRLRRPDGAAWRTVRTHSLAQAGGSVGFLLFYATDALVIAYMPKLGLVAVTVYALASRWDPFVRMIVLQMLNAARPLLTQKAQQQGPESLAGDWIAWTRRTLLMGWYPTVTLAVLAGPFLSTWVGAEIASQGAWIMTALMAVMGLCLPQLAAYAVLQSAGRLGRVAMITVVAGVVNVGLSIVLAGPVGWGLWGIAAGTMLTMWVSAWATVFLTRRDVAGSWWEYFVHGIARPAACAAILIAIVVAIRICWPTTTLLMTLVQLALPLIPYTLCVYGIGLTTDERSRTRRFLFGNR